MTKRHSIHSFDIDNYLNYIIPRPRWHLVPRPISFWFGYRAPSTNPNKPSLLPSNTVVLVWLFSFLGGFIGIAIIENVFLALPSLSGNQVPIIIASYGAAAILEYNTIESPLSQPRNLIFGHLFSGVIGVGITKLFRLLPEARFEELKWLAGALSVGSASAVMSITKTVHPPAGATALLAATMPEFTVLGWWMLPLVLLASCLMLASAMIVNNLYKRFPLYWWTPVDLSGFMFGKEDIVKAGDVERADTMCCDPGSSVDSLSDAGLKKTVQQTPNEERQGSNVADARHYEGEGIQYDTVEKKRQRNIHENPEMKVQIELDRIVVPDWLNLSSFEVQFLEEIQWKLREGTEEKEYLEARRRLTNV